MGIQRSRRRKRENRWGKQSTNHGLGENQQIANLGRGKRKGSEQLEHGDPPPPFPKPEKVRRKSAKGSPGHHPTSRGPGSLVHTWRQTKASWGEGGTDNRNMKACNSSPGRRNPRRKDVTGATLEKSRKPEMLTAPGVTKEKEKKGSEKGAAEAPERAFKIISTAVQPLGRGQRAEGRNKKKKTRTGKRGGP